MRTAVSIGVAGALGALARYGVQSLVARHGHFPWGTFVVNVSGAFALGLLFTVIVHRFTVPMWIQAALLIGFLGGYTTFSTLTLETFVLLEQKRFVLAVAYSAGSLVTGLVAVLAGIRLGRMI